MAIKQFVLILPIMMCGTAHSSVPVATDVGDDGALSVEVDRLVTAVLAGYPGTRLDFGPHALAGSVVELSTIDPRSTMFGSCVAMTHDFTYIDEAGGFRLEDVSAGFAVYSIDEPCDNPDVSSDVMYYVATEDFAESKEIIRSLLDAPANSDVDCSERVPVSDRHPVLHREDIFKDYYLHAVISSGLVHFYPKDGREGSVCELSGFLEDGEFRVTSMRKGVDGCLLPEGL